MGEDGNVTYAELEGIQPGSTTESTDPAKNGSSEPFSWWNFLRNAKDEQITARLQEEIKTIVDASSDSVRTCCLLGLYEPKDQIDSWDANRIYSALEAENPKGDKNVLLLIASFGGRVEPAYQISKICKKFSNSHFIVTIPRAAKSAATLVALGADEIHMGALGELGPIDPQLGDLPALGVKKAIETIAEICEKYPRSSDAFANYMSKRITIEQIGYCGRVVESAVQYAERLLSKKTELKHRAPSIAKQLVHAYMHHGFVIDIEEARQLLGDFWIKSESDELKFAEKIYQLLDLVNFILAYREKKVLVIGSLTKGTVILEDPQE